MIDIDTLIFHGYEFLLLVLGTLVHLAYRQTTDHKPFWTMILHLGPNHQISVVAIEMPIHSPQVGVVHISVYGSQLAWKLLASQSLPSVEVVSAMSDFDFIASWIHAY